MKRLCLANVALSFKLQPESEMGLSRSSNPQASDEAWFSHKSCHDIHYSASHRASLPRPPVHFRWTTLRLRATQCKCYTSKEREPEEGFEKHIRTDSPQSTVSTPAKMAVTTGQCLIAITTAFWLGSFQDQKLTPKLGTHSFQAHCGLCINGMPLATL